jgi:bifunctional non-homologous end joining protein LigD
MKTRASFIEPMLLLGVRTLPDDAAHWVLELKIDGYRAVAFSAGGRVHLRSRHDKDFSLRYPAVARALASLPPDTVVDGEVVALDPEGRPSFSILQNYGSSAGPVVYFLFDVMVLEGRSLRGEPLSERRRLLEHKVLPGLKEPVRCSPTFDAPLADLTAAVRAQGLEGLVAKRRDSRYEPGLRSGAWQKMRINRGQEFVIGGFTPGTNTFDALIIGYYTQDGLVYAARTRNGFTPASRQSLFRRFRPLEIATCPFVNLPETGSGRWGQGLTAAKMKDCRWLAPVLVGQFEFVEWTPEGHLRHSHFVALREDKSPRDVHREA